MFKFELGLKAKDIVTQYTGIIMGRAQYLTGCNQYGICPQKLKEDGTTHDWIWFDENRLKILEGGVKLNSTIDNKPGFDGNHPNKH